MSKSINVYLKVFVMILHAIECQSWRLNRTAKPLPPVQIWVPPPIKSMGTEVKINFKNEKSVLNLSKEKNPLSRGD